VCYPILSHDGVVFWVCFWGVAVSKKVGAAPVEVSSTAAALLRACGPHYEKDLQVG
jgi:hypothetical protein